MVNEETKKERQLWLREVLRTCPGGTTRAIKSMNRPAIAEIRKGGVKGGQKRANVSSLHTNISKTKKTWHFILVNKRKGRH